MAKITRTTNLPDSANKADFYSIVEDATISNIVNADIKSDAAIADTKLAQITTAGKVSGAALTSLVNIPAGAGEIPAANLPVDTDGTLSANSDSKVPSQKATKTYVDTSLDINAKTEKTSPVDNDIILIEDSEASYAKKKVKKSNLAPKLGAWVSKSDNTVYQASIDGFVTAYKDNSSGADTIVIYTDSSNPPTTIRTAANKTATGYYMGVSCPIKKNDYYKVYANGTLSGVYWIPFGS